MSGSTLSNRPRWVYTCPIVWNAQQATAAGDYGWHQLGNLGLANGNTGGMLVEIDPADYDVYDMATNFYLEALVGSGDTTPGGTWYLTLFPVTAPTGTSSARTTTLGTEVPGARSTTWSTPAANTIDPLRRGPNFTLSAAGLYIPVVHLSAAWTALTYMTGQFRIAAVPV